MKNNIKLPSFFVIGMQKSATTTVHNWLSEHKELCLPLNKETHFFSNVTLFEKGIEWYLENFENINSSSILGEVDPSYIFIDKSLNRIKEKIFNPKFIIIIRNPLERSYSHYCMNKYKGYEEFSFSEAIECESFRIKENDDNVNKFSYLLRSAYSSQISNLIKIFPHSKILYIKFDDMTNPDSQKSTYQKICNFLKVSDNLNINLSQIHNSTSNFKNIRLRNFLYKDNFIKNILKLFISEKYQYKIKMKLDYYNRTDKKINNYNEIIRLPKKYFEWSNDEVEKTMEITNLNLKDWIYISE